jgi:hypothetical protein
MGFSAKHLAQSDEWKIAQLKSWWWQVGVKFTFDQHMSTLEEDHWL